LKDIKLKIKLPNKEKQTLQFQMQPVCLLFNYLFE